MTVSMTKRKVTGFRPAVRRLAGGLFVLLCLLFSLTVVAAPEAGDKAEPAEPLAIEMESKVIGHKVYPGDEIRLIVTFKSDKPFGAEVLGSLSLGDFDLKDRDKWRGEEDGRQVCRHTFTMIRFEPGRYDLPIIPFVLKQGGNQEERRTELIRVEVASILEEEAQKIALQKHQDRQSKDDKSGAVQGGAKIIDPKGQVPVGPTFNVPGGQLPGSAQLPPGAAPGQQAPGQQVPGQEPEKIQLAPRDIKGPVQLVREDYLLLYVLGGALALLLFSLLLWWFLKRPRSEAQIESEDLRDMRPAHIIALEQLERLEAEQLVAKRRIKDFHLRISEILREYFERRYNLEDALSLTGSEVLVRLKNLYLRDLSENVVRDLMMAVDLVIFARDEPADETCFDHLSQARMIITRTKEESLGIQ